MYNQSVVSSGDSLTDASISWAYLNGQRFSTWDRDQDSSSRRHCAQWVGGGAWWYNDCFLGHLNGIYVDGGHTSWGEGLIWYTWKDWYYSLKRTEMKIKPNI